MPEQQQAAQTPNPTVPTTPVAAPVRPPEPKDDLKFKGDVSALLGDVTPAEEEQDEHAGTDAAETGDADATAVASDPSGDNVGDTDDSVAARDAAAEGEETAAGGEPVADSEPTPEATEPAPAPAAPAAAEQEQAAQRAARKAEVKAALKAVTLKLAALKGKGTVDPFEATELQTDASLLQSELAEINDAEVEHLRQQEAARQEKSSTDTWWQKWAAETPEVGTRGRDIFLEEEEKALKRFGSATPEQRAAAQAAATVAWENRVALVKGQAAAKAGKAASPTTTKPLPTKPTAPAGKGKPGGAPVLPAQTTPARQTTKPKTAEEEFATKEGFSVKSLMG